MVFGAIQRTTIAHAVEFVTFECLDDFGRIEGASAFDRIRIEQGLHIGGVGGLGRRGAIGGAEGLGEGDRAGVLQVPVPVGGAEDTTHGFAGALGHQFRHQRGDDLELLAIGLTVAQAELYGLGQRVHHVEAVVVEDQHVGAGIEDRRQVLGIVGGAERSTDRRDGLPAELFGGFLDRLFLGPTPGIVGGEVIGAAIIAVFFAEHRAERDAGLVGIEEVAEAVAALVLAGGVVGVCQAGHEDDALFLAQSLNGNGFARGRAAGDHDGAIALDHAGGAGAGHV